eukprot:PhM_4_TR18508/c1_g1_i1/m.56620
MYIVVHASAELIVVVVYVIVACAIIVFVFMFIDYVGFIICAAQAGNCCSGATPQEGCALEVLSPRRSQSLLRRSPVGRRSRILSRHPLVLRRTLRLLQLLPRPLQRKTPPMAVATTQLATDDDRNPEHLRPAGSFVCVWVIDAVLDPKKHFLATTWAS